VVSTAVQPLNGTVQHDDTVSALEEQLSKGYRPSLPIEGFFGADGNPQMWLIRDIEAMLTHPVVRQALSYFKGGVAGAEFWGGPNPDAPDAENDKGLPICPSDDQVGRYVKEQCERFWDRGVPSIQHGYEYGWVGCENIYTDEDGVLKWDNLSHFAPRDTYLLTQDYTPIGIRVKNVLSCPRPLDLWMAGDEVPAKGLWYAHNPRYNTFYGQSQLLAAWRPWRRLAWKDGAEQVLDGAMYRFGYQGPIMRYPDEDLQGPTGVPNTTQDSQGRPRRYARDIMRQIGEQYKAGAVVGLPSKRDAKGEYMYDMTLPAGTLVGLNNLIDGVEHLGKQITQGIGVPPELLEASETGSGYSGRRIPMDAFLANQQQIADAILKLFVDQILTPLVRRNFGWGIRFNVQVKSLIKSHAKAAQTQNPGTTNAQAGQPAPQQRPQPNDQDQLQQARQQNNNQMFSHAHPLVTDRLREIARKIAKVA
jgi:hypothetical protein